MAAASPSSAWEPRCWRPLWRRRGWPRAHRPLKLKLSGGTKVSSNKSTKNDNRGSVMIKAVATAVEPAERAAGQAPVQSLYLEALTLVERLHRRLLDVIKDEFDRRGRADINSVQALLLYNIGDKELTAGELRTRGYYLGSNVSRSEEHTSELQSQSNLVCRLLLEK